VVGAGVAGLATAGALARTGWRVTLLERAERLRADPVALLLWPGGVRALRALGLGAGLDAIATATRDRGVRRPDGQWLVRPGSADRWGPPVLVHAEDLHHALIAGLGDRVEIHTGVPVRPAPAGDLPGVTDGRATWRADLVVAADGVDSELRRSVDPAATVVSAGSTAWRAVIPWYRAPALPVEGGQTRGPRGLRFFSAPLGERGAGGSNQGGMYWCATAAGSPRPESAQTQLGLLRRWFADWHAPVAALLAATEPADLVQRELRALRPALRCYSVPVGGGGLVLVGDAAHALADHLGQGACLAVEDAATLVAVGVAAADPGSGRGGGAVAAAIGRYDVLRRRRLAEVLRRSRRLAGGGPVGRLATVQARRRERAAASAATWQPPPG
jgi:2-polyprenyl-6-methoxyphenol hydroxylase-like FAD-dependent oxidoreductase